MHRTMARTKPLHQTPAAAYAFVLWWGKAWPEASQRALEPAEVQAGVRQEAAAADRPMLRAQWKGMSKEAQ